VDLEGPDSPGAQAFGNGPGGAWVIGGNALTATGFLGSTTDQVVNVGANNLTEVTLDGSSVAIVAPTGNVSINGLARGINMAGGTSIGQSAIAVADGTCLLDLQATTQGLGLPSLTRAAINALVNPPARWMGFDNTNKIAVVNVNTAGSPVFARAAGGPNVFASTTAAPSIPNGGTGTTVIFTATTNTGSQYNGGTGVFTAPVPGFYYFSAQVQFAAAASAVASEFRVSLFKNGATTVAQGMATSQNAAASVKQAPAVSTYLALNAGDTIAVQAFQNGNGGGALALTSDGTLNFFSAALVN
jgi:hypothetical protein